MRYENAPNRTGTFWYLGMRWDYYFYCWKGEDLVELWTFPCLSDNPFKVRLHVVNLADERICCTSQETNYKYLVDFGEDCWG
jgi:hypothetical protein